MLQGARVACGDAVTDLDRLPSDLYREVAPSAEEDKTEGEGRGGSQGQGQGVVLDEYGLPAYLSNPLFLLLEAAVFTAGTLRSYSSSSVNARRLMLFGLIE